MNNLFLSFTFIILFSVSGVSQSDFVSIEKELAFHCDVMVNAAEGRHREKAQDNFLKGFNDALNQQGSFLHPFDSLKWISKKMPEDKSFRIFTWEVKGTGDEYKYYGFIQWPDGKLITLNDRFKEAEDLKEEEFTPENWLGALYYNLMEVNPSNGEKYYLLFGINRWDKAENVKLVDVLFFTKTGQPIFGKPVFRKSEDKQVDVFYNRLLFKYAADGHMTVNYNPGMEMIVFDNLIPKMSRIPGQSQTYVSDGSYVGYAWDKKNWNLVNKIATEVMETAPRPNPILDKRKGKKINGEVEKK